MEVFERLCPAPPLWTVPWPEIRASFDTVIEMRLLEAEDEMTRVIRVYSHRGTHSSKWFKFFITPERTVKIT